MSVILYLVVIEAQNEIKQKVQDFMGDMYPSNEAIRFIKDDYDLAFLTKCTGHLNALMQDAKLTYGFKFSVKERTLDSFETKKAIKEIAEDYGDDENELLDFFAI